MILDNGPFQVFAVIEHYHLFNNFIVSNWPLRYTFIMMNVWYAIVEAVMDPGGGGEREVGGSDPPLCETEPLFLK